MLTRTSEELPGPTPNNSLCSEAAGYSPHASGNIETPDCVSEDVALEQKIGDRYQKFLNALPNAEVDTQDIQTLDWCSLVEEEDVFDEEIKSLENTLEERLVKAREALNELADGCSTRTIGGQSSEEERRAELRSVESHSQVSASGCEDKNCSGAVAEPLAACVQPNRLITLFGKAAPREKPTDRAAQSVVRVLLTTRGNPQRRES